MKVYLCWDLPATEESAGEIAGKHRMQCLQGPNIAGQQPTNVHFPHAGWAKSQDGIRWWPEQQLMKCKPFWTSSLGIFMTCVFRFGSLISHNIKSVEPWLDGKEERVDTVIFIVWGKMGKRASLRCRWNCFMLLNYLSWCGCRHHSSGFGRGSILDIQKMFILHIIPVSGIARMKHLEYGGRKPG